MQHIKTVTNLLFVNQLLHRRCEDKSSEEWRPQTN